MAASRVQSLEPRPQLAALPWRRVDAGIEVLIVTSRVSQHWLIPKGWPMKGRSHADAAAVEAFEEAGVKGRISPSPLGTYQYDKILQDGGSIPCRVDVYALEVRKELESWPEQPVRQRRWVALNAAWEDVHEPDLGAFLRGIAPEALEPDRSRKVKR